MCVQGPPVGPPADGRTHFRSSSEDAQRTYRLMKVDILQTWGSSLSERQSFVGFGPFGGVLCSDAGDTHAPLCP